MASCTFVKPKECVCTNTDCERRTQCCLCVAHHRSRGNLPTCLRPPAPEEEKK